MPLRRLPGRNVSKADVALYDLDGLRVALKDYSGRGWLARQTVGRLLVARECRAYASAAGCTGLAPFLGRVGPFALATAWVDGTPLASLERLDDAVFDRLDALLGALHARGIALGDLHHRDVLLTPGGDVRVVDLAAAVVRERLIGPFRAPLFERAAAQDRVAAARMRARFTGRDEDEALARLDPRAVRLWRRGRRIKALWDRLRGRHA